MKKIPLAIAVAFALGVAPVTFAQEDNDVVDVDIQDSFKKEVNVDNSTDVNVDKEVNVEKSFDAQDSFNKEVKVDKSVNDSFKVTTSDSFNTDNSTDNSVDNSVEIGDIAVSAAVLVGSASSGTVTVDNGSTYTSGNEIAGGAFASASGITSTAQNSGINGAIQQGVSVQSNLTMGGN